jgi:hypothetical protein
MEKGDTTVPDGSQPAGASERVPGEAAKATGDDADFSAAGLAAAVTRYASRSSPAIRTGGHARGSGRSRRTGAGGGATGDMLSRDMPSSSQIPVPGARRVLQ